MLITEVEARKKYYLVVCPYGISNKWNWQNNNGTMAVNAAGTDSCTMAQTNKQTKKGLTLKWTQRSRRNSEYNEKHLEWVRKSEWCSQWQYVSHSESWLKNKCHVSSYQFVLHILFITSKLAQCLVGQVHRSSLYRCSCSLRRLVSGVRSQALCG